MIKRSLVVLALSTFACSFTFAQTWEDSAGNNFVPQFCYYAEDGFDLMGNEIAAGSFTIRNAGANGVVDSADNGSQAGDDYGMISVLISITQDFNATQVLPLFDNNVLWNTFDPFFNGQVQFSGATTPLGQFLPISEADTVLWTMDTGLTAADFVGPSGFIEIETGYNLRDGEPGGTLMSVGDPTLPNDNLADGGAIFTVVGHVPEPSSLSLLGLALLGGLGFRRRS